MCVIISVLMITSVLTVNVSAAAKPKLSSTSLTMLVGSGKTLKVTGARDSVTWSSSDTSVCSVSSKGKVKAKSTGTAKICAKVGNKKLYCKVKVVESYIGTASPKTINKGQRVTLSFKSYNVKAAEAYSSDAGIVRIVKSYISEGNIKVVIEGVSGGSAYINVADRDNADAISKVKIIINAPVEAAPDMTDETGYIQIKVIDNGDGTASIILVPAENDEISELGETGDRENFAEKMLELVNAERSEAGLSALTLDDDLCRAAQVRAGETAESFSHTRPDGRDCFSVLDDYNISHYCAAENIARGSSTAEGAMRQWMNSPGHRSNILYPSVGKLGVGYDEATNSWVQLFTD